MHLKDDNKIFQQKLKDSIKRLNGSAKIKIEGESNPGDYYKLVQFKFFIEDKEKRSIYPMVVLWTGRKIDDNQKTTAGYKWDRNGIDP